MKMKLLKSLSVAALSLCVVGVPASSSGQDKKTDKPKEVVDRVREADPPKEGNKKESPEKIAKEENAKQKERDKETAKKYPPIRKEPPSPK